MSEFDPAKRLQDKIVDAFRANLNDVAYGLACMDKSTTIQERHVLEAARNLFWHHKECVLPELNDILVD